MEYNNEKPSKTPAADLEFQTLEKELAELREVVNVLEARLSFVVRENEKPQLEIDVRASGVPLGLVPTANVTRDPISPLIHRIRQNLLQVSNVRVQILSILTRLDL